MKEVVDYLKSTPVHYLATVGTDGKPKVRPFQFMLEEEGKLYFCTSNRKDVFKELQSQPWIELCASGKNHSWMRLKGKAVFSKDIGLRAKVLEANPLVKSLYKSAENPAFEIFYVADAIATMYDFSGNAPKVVEL
jgi:uncharacterized pyridoxamine 5'-phosphate oxidase family protein